MLVRFVVDYRGHLTAEHYFLAGSQADFDAPTAAQLIADGRAVAVKTTDPSTPLRAGDRRPMTDDGDRSSVPAAMPKKRAR